MQSSRRKVAIQTRVSDDERAAIKRKAEMLGLSLSAWVRMELLAAAERPPLQFHLVTPLGSRGEDKP
jgi:uncharacterized protein (DUF1778 family)